MNSFNFEDVLSNTNDVYIKYLFHACPLFMVNKRISMHLCFCLLDVDNRLKKMVLEQEACKAVEKNAYKNGECKILYPDL